MIMNSYSNKQFVDNHIFMSFTYCIIIRILYFVKWRTRTVKPSTVPEAIYRKDEVHLSEGKIVENEDDFELPPPEDV